MISRVVGLDLGRQDDYTALSIVDMVRPDAGPPEIHVRRMERVRHQSYPAVVTRVASMLKDPALAGCPVIVDATGVGRAVVDMLREVATSVEALVITSGREVTNLGPNEYHVPKNDLVAALQVLVASRRLKVSAADPLAAEFHKEMQSFGYEINDSGHKAFGGQGATHDDLVLSVAMAAWRLSIRKAGHAWLEGLQQRLGANREPACPIP